MFSCRGTAQTVSDVIRNERHESTVKMMIFKQQAKCTLFSSDWIIFFIGITDDYLFLLHGLTGYYASCNIAQQTNLQFKQVFIFPAMVVEEEG